MVRVGLSFYLILTTVAGPWLCCCTAAHAPALFGAKASNASPSRPCCGRHAPPVKAPASGDEGARSDGPTAPHGPCRCQENSRSRAAFVAPERSSAPETVVGVYEADLPFAFLTPGAVSRLNTTHEPVSFPFCTPRDMLRALQIMRC